MFDSITIKKSFSVGTDDEFTSTTKFECLHNEDGEYDRFIIQMESIWKFPDDKKRKRTPKRTWVFSGSNGVISIKAPKENESLDFIDPYEKEIFKRLLADIIRT